MLVFAGSLASFVALAALQARRRKDRFSIRLAVVSGVVFAAVVPSVPPPIAIVLAVLVTSATSDACSGYAYDAVTAAGALGVAIAVCATNGMPSALEGAAFAGTAALAISVVSRRGLGAGDVKTFALSGAAFGPVAGMRVLGGAFVIGAIVVVPLLLGRIVQRRAMIPFVPCIAASALLVATTGAYA